MFRRAIDAVGSSTLTLGALAFSLALNLIMSESLRRQDRVILSLKEQSDIAVGQLLPPASGVDSEGRSLSIGYQHQLPVVIYVKRRGCLWCDRNRANEEILSQLPESQFDVVIVELDSSARVEDRLPVTLYPDAQTIAEYRMGGTPQTIVVGPGGVVRGHWRGAYNRRTAKDIGAALNVDLVPLR